MATVGPGASDEANPRKPLRFRAIIPKIDPENPEAPDPVVLQFDSVDEAVEYGKRVRGLGHERRRTEIMGLLGRLVGAEPSSSGEAPPPAAPPGPVPPSASMPAERKWIRQGEFALRHSVSVSQVRKWCMHGLPTNGIKGRGVRIKVTEGDAWVEAGGPELVRLYERKRRLP